MTIASSFKFLDETERLEIELAYTGRGRMVIAALSILHTNK